MEQDFSNFSAVLQKAFTENGLNKYLNYEHAKQFESFARFLLEENEKYNLTAIKEPGKVALLHFVDCVALAPQIKEKATVLDVGCGAGFPTIPLAIVRPDLKIVSLDATEKKIRFIEMSKELLGIQNIETHVGRAEDFGTNPAYREQADYVTARAVANMRELLELCLPLLKIGGTFLAMKGKNVRFELQDSKKALSLLGGRLIEVDEQPLQSSVLGEQQRAVVIIKKEKKTPQAYPRAYAQISKHPL